MAAERPIDPDAVLFTGVANRLALAYAVLVADQTLTSEGAFCAAVRASPEEDGDRRRVEAHAVLERTRRDGQAFASCRCSRGLTPRARLNAVLRA